MEFLLYVLPPEISSRSLKLKHTFVCLFVVFISVSLPKKTCPAVLKIVPGKNFKKKKKMPQNKPFPLPLPSKMRGHIALFINIPEH